MKPLDTGTSTAGLIAPELQHAVPEGPAESSAAAAPATAPDPGAAIQDVPLVPRVDEESPGESPEFVLSQRVADDGPAPAGMPGGMPGLSGLGGEPPEAQDILSGAVEDVSEQANQVFGVVNEAAAPVIDTAQGLLGQAATAAGVAAPTGAGAAPGAPAAAAPTMPTDPVEALLSGAALPALPGIDVLFAPIRELLGSFGTGVMGALDPTAILSQASQVIEMAMGVGKSSLAAMGQSWESEAAQTAQTAGQEANNSGVETSQRGFDISAMTQAAASVVQQGNAQLTNIAASFLTQATALAPVVMTPPAQTALIASATEHLGQAVTVTNITRGDLAGRTAELSGVVQQMLGVDGQQAAQAAQQAAQSVGEPMLQQAQSLASDPSTLDSVLGSTTGDPASTTVAGLSTGSPGSPGAPGGPSGSPGLSTGGTPSVPGAPSSPGLPGSTTPPLTNALRPGGLPAGMAPAATTPASSGFMGGAPGAAGQRNSDEEHGRTVESYRSASGNDDLTGPLGESAPEVIGAVDPDDDIGYDSQF